MHTLWLKSYCLGSCQPTRGQLLKLSACFETVPQPSYNLNELYFAEIGQTNICALYIALGDV